MRREQAWTVDASTSDQQTYNSRTCTEAPVMRTGQVSRNDRRPFDMPGFEPAILVDGEPIPMFQFQPEPSFARVSMHASGQLQHRGFREGWRNRESRALTGNVDSDPINPSRPLLFLPC